MSEVHAQEAPSILDLSVVPSGAGVSARCEFEGYEAGGGYSMELYLNQVKADGTEIEITLKGIFPPTNGAGIEITEGEAVEPGIYKATLVVNRTDGDMMPVDNFRNSLLYDVTKDGESYIVTPYQEPGEEPGAGNEPGSGNEPEPDEGPGTGNESEPDDEPGTGNEPEPDDEPGAGDKQEPDNESGAGNKPEPGEGAEAGNEQKPGNGSDLGDEPEIGDMPEEKPQEPFAEEGSGSEQASCSHSTVHYRIVNRANPNQDAVLAGECNNCGEVLSYSFVPNSAYAAFLEEAAGAIQNAQTGEVVIETERWISFNQSVFDAMAMRPEVSVTVRYRYGESRYEVTIPAGAEVSGLADENGFCGFRHLDQVFGGKEIVE